MNIKFSLFKPRKMKTKNYEPSAPPDYSDFQELNGRDMVCW